MTRQLMNMNINALLERLHRDMIGVDRFFDALQGDFVQTTGGYPPHNVEQLSEDDYRLTIAVAGFNREDIELTVREGMLIVEGRKQETDEDRSRNYLYKGIANRAFTKSFRMGEYIEVADANLIDGVLTVDLHREVPEIAKPKRIAIGNRSTIDAKEISSKKFVADK
jgi:molecular chaperone IbpA